MAFFGAVAHPAMSRVSTKTAKHFLGIAVILAQNGPRHKTQKTGLTAGPESGIIADVTDPARRPANAVSAPLPAAASASSPPRDRTREIDCAPLAVLITGVTFVFNRAATVHFGILHCLGASILIYGLAFEKAKTRACAAAGVAVLAASVAVPLALKGVAIRFDWLPPLRIH